MNKITYTIEIEPEWMSIEGNASAISEEEDQKTYDWIYDQLNRGNQWAWCQVKVTAHYRGFEGVDYLGGCSYESEEQFKEGLYYQSMCDIAKEDLINSLYAAYEAYLELTKEK